MKSYRVNGFLVIAIVTAVLLLLPTVYGGIMVFSDRANSMTTTTFNIKRLESIPSDTRNILTSSDINLPANLKPEVFLTSTITGIPTSHIGFALYTNQTYGEITSPKLLAMGIAGGIHKGGMIFKTGSGVAVASPLGLFVQDTSSWKRDFSNLTRQLAIWYEAEGVVAGDTHGFEFLDFFSRGTAGWDFSGSHFECTTDKLNYTPSVLAIDTITASPLIPNLPPILYLAIAALLLIVAGVLLWKIGLYDMSIAGFALIPATVLIGGMSIFATSYLPSSIIPLTTFLAGGLAWSIPLIFLWNALGLDKALGLFWISFAVIYGITILDNLFPFVWLITIGLLTLTVIMLAVKVPVQIKEEDVRLL